MILVKSRRRLALLIAFTVLNTASFAETLGDVLRNNQVPLPATTVANVEQRVTSYAVLDNPDAFAIAYYRDDGSNLLSPPLYLLRYFKRQHRWQTGALRQASVNIGPFSDLCFGSAQTFEEFYGVLYITTHLNPSAECTLILGQDLRLKKTLYGWYLGSLRNGLVIFHNSEVHFAPTHPMEISIYDPRKGTERKIYPPFHDTARDRYIDALDAVPPDDQWCRENNSHCETGQFSSELVGPVEINERTASFGFIAQFTSEGYGPKAEKEVGERHVIYIYRFIGEKLVHRELEIEKAEELFGTSSVGALLHPKLLQRIFRERADALK
jgi:hypothetical protein